MVLDKDPSRRLLLVVSLLLQCYLLLNVRIGTSQPLQMQSYLVCMIAIDSNINELRLGYLLTLEDLDIFLFQLKVWIDLPLLCLSGSCLV